MTAAKTDTMAVAAMTVAIVSMREISLTRVIGLTHEIDLTHEIGLTCGSVTTGREETLPPLPLLPMTEEHRPSGASFDARPGRNLSGRRLLQRAPQRQPRQ